MDTSQDITADLTPLEQRRARLRAFADRVLEAVEALPMPKTAIDSERTLRAITAADRMLVQIYSRVTPLQQQPISHTASRATYTSFGHSAGSAPSASRAPNPPKETPEEPEAVPFVYNDDDDETDDDFGDAPEADAESLSPSAQAALDLEQQANEIFQAYLKAIAENPDPDTDSWQNTGPP